MKIKFFDIELRDTLNYLPYKIDQISSLFCSKNKLYVEKSFQKEKKECINECYILEEGIMNLFDTFYSLFNQYNCFTTANKIKSFLDISSIAYNAFKEISFFNKYCPKTTTSEYKKFFPAYINYFSYKTNENENNVEIIKNNLLIPHIYSSIDMPIGKPIFKKSYHEAKKYKFFICNITIEYDLKDNFIPIISTEISGYHNLIYSMSSKGDFIELLVCNYDLEIIQKFYNYTIIFNWFYCFKTKKEMYKKYSEMFINFKKENKNYNDLVDKLLNIPCEKIANNGFKDIKKYFIDKNSNTVSSYIKGYEIIDNDYEYLPAAIAITAAARNSLLNTAYKIGFPNIIELNYNNIIYKK